MSARILNTIQARGKRLVCRIYDLGSNHLERYTVAFRSYRGGSNGNTLVHPYLGASDDPYHPQGVGQHGESKTYVKGRELGKRASFESLPLPVQKFILANI